MGFLPELQIQDTGQDMSTLIRVLNERLRLVQREVNLNFQQAYLQVNQIIEEDGVWPIWIPASDFEIVSWVLRVSGTTTNPDVDLLVDGVSVADETLTTTNVNEYVLSPAEVVTRLQRVAIETATMTAGEEIAVSLVLRRTTEEA